MQHIDQTNFQQFKQEVEDELNGELLLGLEDTCFDDERLKASFCEGEEPKDIVDYLVQKFGLTRNSEIGF